MNKGSFKTLILGASTNETRYSNIVTKRLVQQEIEVVPIGIRKGEIDGVTILQGMPHIENVHTVSLYLNPKRQEEYYDYIISLKPHRIIFNPGTENIELWERAKKEGIQCLEACTLVMLSTGSYLL